MRSTKSSVLAAGLASSLVSTAFAQGPAPTQLPPVPVPVANPITEPKRVLGKVLFWDERLSTSGTMSCGTCHMPSAGGGDPRRARNNGIDNILNTADDVLASPGVIASDRFNEFRRSPETGLSPQITGRNSPMAIGAMYSPTMFWDGRAVGQFRDPQTGAILINNGGALENQAVGPVLSDVEMAHDQRTWEQVASRLGEAKPLALATNIPADVALALSNNKNYAALFREAFGDDRITAARIGMAIATYERTLLPNQTPFDRWAAGDQTALTANQRQGWAVFNAPQSNCNICHTPPVFSNHTFRNIGVRPVAEDLGRFAITGANQDRGRFKVPVLRNTGLKGSYMHNGMFTTITDVVRFYAQAPGAPVMNTDNLDPAAAAIGLPPLQQNQLIDFLENALTDPRVVAETFPFDKPQVWTERTSLQPSQVAIGVIAAGLAPGIIVVDPALIGTSFRVGLSDVPAGSVAQLRYTTQAPPAVTGPVILSGGSLMDSKTANADGLATERVELRGAITQPNVPLYLQWAVTANGNTAYSPVVRVIPFCPTGGCPGACAADIGAQGGIPGGDAQLDNNDFAVFINLFFGNDFNADVGSQGGIATPDGRLDNNDFAAFVGLFFAGC